MGIDSQHGQHHRSALGAAAATTELSEERPLPFLPALRALAACAWSTAALLKERRIRQPRAKVGRTITYLLALGWVLAPVSEKGSVHYAVLPGLDRDEVLADPAVIDERLDTSKGGWWRPLERTPG